MQGTSIRTPGSIWAKLIDQNNANSKSAGGRLWVSWGRLCRGPASQRQVDHLAHVHLPFADKGRGDAYCYFVGSRGSGKSTLLNRFLYPSRVGVAALGLHGTWHGLVRHIFSSSSSAVSARAPRRSYFKA